jgi:hypothetical protein
MRNRDLGLAQLLPGQNPRHECVAAERPTILRKRDLVLSATVEVIDYDPGQPAASQFSQIGNVDRIRDAHQLWLPIIGDTYCAGIDASSFAFARYANSAGWR